MATSSFSKTFIIDTDEAADALIQCLETRMAKPAGSHTYKTASQETIERKFAKNKKPNANDNQPSH